MCLDNNEEQDEYYIHLLLEVYCSYGWHGEKYEEVPEYCKNGIKHPGYYCLENDCQFKSFTYADNEICYTGEKGEVKEQIGFGGDMESQDYDEDENKKRLSLWESICRRKISEAYEEFKESIPL